MRWLLLRLYLDLLENSWAAWDEDIRQDLLGRSLPPIAVGPSQAMELIAQLAVCRAAAERRRDR